MNMGISTNGINQIGINSKITTRNADLKSKAEQKAASSFDDMMGMVSGETAKNNSSAKLTPSQFNNKTNKVGVKETNDLSENISGNKKEVSSGTKTEDKSTVKDNKTENAKTQSKSNKTDKTNKYEKCAKATNSNDADKVDEIDVDTATKILTGIINAVSEITGVSVDDIQSMMEQLGMENADLLDQTMVQKLVLSLNDASDVNLLIDENLADQIKNVNNAISEVLSENGIENADTFTNFVLENNVEINADIVKNIETSNKQESVSGNAGVEISDNMETETTTEQLISSVSTNEEETSNSSESNMFENNSQQNSGDMDASSLVDNLGQAIANAVNNVSGVETFSEDIQAADIVRQVVDNIKANISEKVKTLELRLNPENLGRVQISVTAKNGVMQAQIIAENEAAKNAIEGSVALLKEAFDNQDLKVDAVEVMVADYGFFKEEKDAENNQNQKKNSSGGGNPSGVNDDIIDVDSTEAEELEQSIMRTSGNSVSYTV